MAETPKLTSRARRAATTTLAAGGLTTAVVLGVAAPLADGSHSEGTVAQGVVDQAAAATGIDRDLVRQYMAATEQVPHNLYDWTLIAAAAGVASKHQNLDYTEPDGAAHRGLFDAKVDFAAEFTADGNGDGVSDLAEPADQIAGVARRFADIAATQGVGGTYVTQKTIVERGLGTSPMTTAKVILLAHEYQQQVQNEIAGPTIDGAAPTPTRSLEGRELGLPFN